MSCERILFLQPQPCVRALKYAAGIRSRLRSNVFLVFGYLGGTLNHLYGDGDELFHVLVKLNPDNLVMDISALVRQYDIDVIHSHNAPDVLTIAATKVEGDVPVIHDIHELLSTHNTGYYVGDTAKKIVRYREEEMIALTESDGRIYATNSMKNLVQETYGLDGDRDMVFPNMLMEQMIPRTTQRKLSDHDGETHIVYVGTLTSRIKGSHYDLREIFEQIAAKRLHIHIYPTWTDDTYPSLAKHNSRIHYHGHVDRVELPDELTRYDFGWAGLNPGVNDDHLEIAFPNKVMDYVASGLPIVTFHHKTIGEFVSEHKLGLVVVDVADLAELLSNGAVDMEALRNNVLKTRNLFTVESRIQELISFYEKIL